MKLPKLTKLELQIMEALWTQGACSVREIHEAFPSESRPAYTTIQTTVYRLEKKKALRCVKRISKANIFEAVVSRDAAQSGLIDELLSLLGGRARPVTRVMTDNGSCYKSFAFRDACKALGLKHIRTRPYTPKTNGKAERFIQTSLREWAYARAYPISENRKQALDPWLHNYNWHRPHGSLQSMPPISRLSPPMNNLLRLHT